MADEEKTEKATPKRREEARNKGDVARSQEVTTLFSSVSTPGGVGSRICGV